MEPGIYCVMTLKVGDRKTELRWVWTVVEGVAGVKNVLTALRTVGVFDERTVGEAVPQRRSTFAWSSFPVGE